MGAGGFQGPVISATPLVEHIPSNGVDAFYKCNLEFCAGGNEAPDPPCCQSESPASCGVFFSDLQVRQGPARRAALAKLLKHLRQTYRMTDPGRIANADAGQLEQIAVRVIGMNDPESDALATEIGAAWSEALQTASPDIRP